MMEQSVISRLLTCVVSIALVAIPARVATAQGYGPFLEVSKTETGFSIEAEGATLPQVLSAIGEEAGFKVQDSGAERPPIDEFQVRDATLEATLRQLLGTSNHLIVYRGGTNEKIEAGSVEKIILLSPSKRVRAADRPASSLAGPEVQPREQIPIRAADAPPADSGAEITDDDRQREEQLVYGEALQEAERLMVEQLGVDPSDFAGIEPGVASGLPPAILQQLKDTAHANDDAMLPPSAVAPVD
ncbi:MAG: hypothetical protein P8R42_02410 [Candidatus Binatia bacterium]|nr:hypothetical protein [Candidatus Binatia bacterium]